MRKYKPIYSLILLLFLSLNSLAQDSTAKVKVNHIPEEGVLFNMGIYGTFADINIDIEDTARPKYTDFEFGISKRYTKNVYFGFKTGYVSANYLNKSDSFYYRVNQIPFGITTGIWNSLGQFGVDLSTGFLFNDYAETAIKSGTYLSVQGFVFLDGKQHFAFKFGYKTLNNTLINNAYMKREVTSIGFSYNIY